MSTASVDPSDHGLVVGRGPQTMPHAYRPSLAPLRCDALAVVTKTTRAPHDAIFKSVFQEPEHAAAELRHIVPGELASAIQWSSLKLEPDLYAADP